MLCKKIIAPDIPYRNYRSNCEVCVKVWYSVKILERLVIHFHNSEINIRKNSKMEIIGPIINWRNMLCVHIQQAQLSWMLTTSHSRTSLFIIRWSIIQQVHELFQSKFNKECDLVLLFQFTISFQFNKVIQSLLKFSSSSSRHSYTFLYLSLNSVL